MKNLLSTSNVNASVNTVNESKTIAQQLAEEAAQRPDLYIWEEYKHAKRPASAQQEVTYMPLKACVKVLNVALERGDNKTVNASDFRAKLSAAGFGKFTLSAVSFYWDNTTLVVWDNNDAKLVKARIDEAGRPCYRPADLVAAFESKFALALDAAGLSSDAKRAARDAKEAEKAAKRLERLDAKAAKLAEKAAKRAEAVNVLTAGLHRQPTEAEINAYCKALKIA